jgi:response regulator RpfG family c-di-GMP phosphodiesterase
MKAPARLATILAVDDEPSTLILVSGVLRGLGECRILTAANGSEAMVVAERERPDVVISDRFMPGKGGLDLCRWLKSHAELSGVQVMLLTAAADTASIVSGLDVGADDYLTKPFDPSEMQSRVRALLRAKRLSDEIKWDNAELERLNAALQEDLVGIQALLVHTIEMRVPNAAVRAKRACTMVKWIGERIGLEPDALDDTVVAARLHEIGKIAMPDEVLSRKKENRSVEERETFDQYPVFGQMLIGSIPRLKEIALIVRHQLENFDGTGLPEGKMGEEIPIESRILRAAVLLEELPAGAALEERLALLEHTHGTILDPTVYQLTQEYLTVTSDESWLEGKQQVTVETIQPGMVIAMDLVTGSGIKLLPKDMRLTKTQIDIVRAHHHTDPIVNGIYVYAGKK